jgi:hypothetical protein
MSYEFEKSRSSIAWFNLERLAGNGEKEKALGLYRLLAHSFEDKAYALQLEGDILWSFKDMGAAAKYQEALLLYHKGKNYVACTALLEHLWYQIKPTLEGGMQLLDLYAQLSWTAQKTLFVASLDTYYQAGKIAKEIHDELLAHARLKSAPLL